ncbi:LysR family transcriptional regulator [Microbulbifer halophilus]|uniref:LysR family transcriptional regulator n=1 Tax=Microbulbifer halophilus TaxID=453963 RepID=A0ABW5EFE2_9GAMM|nr:LysR family transcriptional regulator [Microbulbifer halophilus]MCW8128448.1 LysR family transcriptional regulator [Microbulbifer halophilus]
MDEQLIRWDDLQIVRAIACNGSLSGAGRQLGLSHATVFRRLTEMERRLGVTLFERSRSGYSQTPAGEDLAAVAARVETDVLGAERRIAGRDIKLSGTIRLTTTDTLYSGLLAPILADFRRKYPQIELELAISNQVHSLSKREADIAIRPTRAPQETLAGRRVGEVRMAVYGARAQWREQPLPLSPGALDDCDWLGPDVHMGDAALEGWMDSRGYREHCRYRIDSLLGIQVAARQGNGVAVLPCYLTEPDEQLLRLTPPIAELATPLWLLIHPDLRRVNRMRIFLDEVGENVRRVLSGEYGA